VVQDADLRKRLNRIADQIVSEFTALPYYKAWHNKHDGWGFDEADKLAGALHLIRLLGTHIPIDTVEWLSQFGRSDDCEKLATRRLTALSASVEHCVLGHTHEPLHRPIVGGSAQKHYLNSGTFRSTFARAASGGQYAQFQRLSYVVIYAPGELDAARQGPMWEMWSGTRRR
jgi:hypothetical protein